MAFFRYEMLCVGFKPRKKFGFETHNFWGGLKPNKSLLQSLGLSSTQQFATRYLSNSYTMLVKNSVTKPKKLD